MRELFRSMLFKRSITEHLNRHKFTHRNVLPLLPTPAAYLSKFVRRVLFTSREVTRIDLGIDFDPGVGGDHVFWNRNALKNLDTRLDNGIVLHV